MTIEQLEYIEKYIKQVNLGQIPKYKEQMQLIFNNMNNELVEFKVPNKYKEIYNELLKKVAYLGEAFIEDCVANCKCENKNVIVCWIVFQAAIVSYNMELDKRADFFIKFVKEQLKLS